MRSSPKSENLASERNKGIVIPITQIYTPVNFQNLPVNTDQDSTVKEIKK